MRIRCYLFISLLFLSCKDEASSQGATEGDFERRSAKVAGSPSVQTKSLPHEVDAVEETPSPDIHEVTDLELLFKEYKPFELARLLKDAFSKSDDRVALAKGLLSNYSGYPSTRAAVKLSSAMVDYPADYVEAVISELHPSDHDRAIGRHLGRHHGLKNRAALSTIYESLEPGVLRSKSCVSLCKLDYEMGGLYASLRTISSLPFQSEKLDSMLGVLSDIASG